MLALILLDWERLGRQLGFGLGFALAAWGMRRLMPRLTEADRWAVGLVWLALCGFVADWAGLHYMVGAFLSGAVLEAHWFGEERLDTFRAVILLALMPVFFLSTGLRTDFSGGGLTVVGAALLLLAASVGGKLLGVHIAGRLLGWRKGEAGVIGWLLQTKALIMIIFANILLDRGILTSASFTALLLMAVASTTLTMPIVARRALAVARG
jgi:Kef-type K+ transport system membrane component KefB